MDRGEEEFAPPDTLVCCMDLLMDRGEAVDVIVVVNVADPTAAPACSDFFVQFSSVGGVLVRTTINSQECPGMDMAVTEKGCRFIQGGSLKPPEDALMTLRQYLSPGRNSIRYSLYDDKDLLMARAEANLYLWNHTDRVIVCDIDGTITKSNKRGILDSVVWESYVHVHDGVCEFLSQITGDEAIRILYLTSRPVGMAETTRRFLSGLRQETSQQLPDGPLFCHTGTMGSVLLSELLTKDMHDFKSDVLVRHIVLTFAAAGRSFTDDLLVAGFGNCLTDSVAYEMAGIQRQDIYVIDKRSQICCLNKDVDTPIVDNVKVNSQGSIVVKGDSQHTLRTLGSSVSSGEENGSSRSERKSLRRNSRSYATLMGTTYSGYRDPRLLQDVLEKMAGIGSIQASAVHSRGEVL